MRPTLFYLPERVAGLPLFGWGWGMILWGIVLVAILANSFLRGKGIRGLIPWSWTLGMTALLIVVFLPFLERMPPVMPSDGLPNHGVPIRGYGVMLAIAASSGMLLAARRAPSRGIHPDVIGGLAVWLALLGILGARILFVIQHLDAYQAPTLGGRVAQMLNIAEGGLVVYGSLIGATLGFLLFTARHHLPRLKLADVIAPSLVLGLAIGRMGCFLNGCCWGGLCELPWRVTFPKDSPPYVDQLTRGWLWGLQVAARDQDIVVSRVFPRSPAARELREGNVLQAINDIRIDDQERPVRDRLKRAEQLFTISRDEITLRLSSGKSVSFASQALPSRSLAIHPTQLYSALGAFALFLTLLAWEPFAKRDGELIALCLTIYPVLRFILESIRDDEPGWLGTSLTISQHLSIWLMVLAIGLWVYIRSPRNAALNV